MKTQAINKMSVTAPISGKIIPITEVPDSVFSEKVLGDGIAIIPSDGKIYSPINGVVSSVAETLHAYGFTSDDGLDVLVHGEYERNDMVEYFGEALGGFVFTEKAWVQSYGTHPRLLRKNICQRRRQSKCR